MRKFIVFLLFLAVMAIAGTLFWKHSAKSEVSFRTALAKRGDVVVAIGATGTVEPEEVIDVGAQVAGRIQSFGTTKDGKTVDYGTPIEEGMILARIDASLYQADVDQASAAVDQAKANVDRSRADLEQMKVKLVEAERNWKRAEELGPSRALSATDYDSYKAAYDSARATVGVGQAALVQAQKGVAQSEASLKRYQTNLSYCTIRSPVEGVIVDRRVNIGQTVVASLNAPSLFLIAKDLRKMQVWVAVNEADIGQIHVTQRVNFTVDAYPNELFSGQVGKIRLNANMVQNVVNYTVEVNTDNSNGKLLPYLTANVQFEVAKHADVLTVPNAALRYHPSTARLVVPEARAEYAERAAARTTRKRSTSRPHARDEAETGVVWVPEGDLVRPIRIRMGLSDGGNTEVQSDDLQEGTEVIISEMTAGNGETARNPFTPQFMGGGRRGG